MTYSTESERRLDPREDVRDEAYHAGDENDAEYDTELDSAARPDATDTVDDETARDDALNRDDGLGRQEEDEELVPYDGTARNDDVALEEREEDETARQERAEDADYDAAHTHEPTAVAVVPMPAADEVGAHEAGTDRDAADARDAGDAVETESGSVYGTATDAGESDAYRADNGPIVAPESEQETAAPAVQDERMPGSVPTTPVAAFWNESDAQGMRERWRELQLRFIDDPESVAGEAEQLVEEAVASLTAALNRAKQDLGNWRDGQGSDTEKLRAAVRTYRDFLDRVLGL